jgi:FAD/FMN-containing dehydrogenase
MKYAYLKELQSHLLGSVTDDADTLASFAHDQSIFEAAPTAVVYPQNTADVRKTVQFSAERAAAGHPLPVIARGKGSSQGGTAIGEGLQLVFPAHMNKLLRLDAKTVTVQPGIVFDSLQQTLNTHGRFLPQAPAGSQYATLGGAVALDSGGEHSVKYGSIRQAVRKLKVVLSDGSIIETSRINARELNRKKGLLTLEGELYRKFDSLLLDNADLIASRRVKDVPNTAGYNLWSVRGRGGTFDLGQVFIGSQGTLGIITEITLSTLPYNPRTTLVVGYFENITRAAEAIHRLRDLEPSAIELVDRNLLEFHHEHAPGDLEGLIPEAIPAVVILVEFDNYSQIAQKLRSTRAERTMRRHGGKTRLTTDAVEQVALWKIRRSPVAAWLSRGPKKALPFMEDAAVPVEKLPQLIEKTYKLLKKHDLKPAIWGHAGVGNIRLQPALNLSVKKDVTKLFELSVEYAQLVTSLGGSLSSSQNDSLLRASGLKVFYGEEFYELLATTKHIFDPHAVLNPTQKTGATTEYALAHLRAEYTNQHLHDYLVYT